MSEIKTVTLDHLPGDSAIQPTFQSRLARSVLPGVFPTKDTPPHEYTFVPQGETLNIPADSLVEILQDEDTKTSRKIIHTETAATLTGPSLARITSTPSKGLLSIFGRSLKSIIKSQDFKEVAGIFLVIFTAIFLMGALVTMDLDFIVVTLPVILFIFGAMLAGGLAILFISLQVRRTQIELKTPEKTLRRVDLL